MGKRERKKTGRGQPWPRLAVASCVLVPVVLCAVLWGSGAVGSPVPSASAEPSLPAQETAATPSVSMPTPTPAPTPTPEPTPSPTPPPPTYDFGEPLEEGEKAADDSVFQRAVFLGDSRTEGLQLWGGLGAGQYYWARGMTVFRVDDPKYTFPVGGKKLTMLDALAQGEYDKVYIMIGVNELGWPADQFADGLGRFLDGVYAVQPDAVIYLQTLPPLNDALARKNLAYYENNDNVDAFNAIICQKAEEKGVVLLDTAEAFRGEDGQLPADWTVDGCHFTKKGYTVWADYLRSHIIDPEEYFRSRAALEEGAGNDESA